MSIPNNPQQTPPPPLPPTPPVVPLYREEEKLHYQSVRTFLLWAVGLVGILITTMIAVGLYFTWSSAKEMREESAATIAELRTQIKETNADAAAAVKAARDDSRDAANDTKNDAKELIEALQTTAKEEVSRVELTTRELAIYETNRQLAEQFKTEKIQDLIQNQAVKEIRTQLVGIVRDETKNLNKISDIGTRARAAMGFGVSDAIRELRSYYQHPTNSSDSLKAKQLYDNISKEYTDYLTAKSHVGFCEAEFLLTDFDENKPLSESNKSALQTMISIIDGQRNENLVGIGCAILNLNRFTKNNFKLFEIDEIITWYNHLKK